MRGLRRRLQAFLSVLAGQKRLGGRSSVLTTAPGATADAADTRPRHAGMAADPFWYNVLESARAIVFDGRAIVFEGCAATRPGIAILPRRATVRCRPCRATVRC